MTIRHTHEHTDLVRRLEESHYIFAQHPKTITEAVKSESASPLDKLFIRAHKIDSNGKIESALDQAKFYIKGYGRLVYIICFLMGFVGVMGLLGTQIINFFYVLLALLGWHSLSLLWWVIGLIRRDDLSFLGGVLSRLTIEKPLLYKIIDAGDNPPMQHALELQIDIHRPVRRWYLGALLHGAWLSSLTGASVALLCLFLFRRYDFTWESTLLTDAHFVQMMQIFGVLPNLLGFDLPNMSAPSSEQNAKFAWLVMLSIALYGILPRFIAYVTCLIKSRHDFQIDQKKPYYATLLNAFSQRVIDPDDYTPSSAIITPPAMDISDKSFISVILERPNDTPITYPSINICHEFGVVDDKSSIDKAISTAKASDALIYLLIDAHILPDRGVMRKVSGLATAGLVAQIINADNVQNNHAQAWHQKLGKMGIAIIDE